MYPLSHRLRPVRRALVAQAGRRPGTPLAGVVTNPQHPSRYTCYRPVMWIVRLALRRPYTFVVVAVLIAILGGTAIVSMPVDIFPYIDIPIVSVLWPYYGLSPDEIEKRVVTPFE